MQSNEQKNNTEISSDENNSVFGSVANNLGAESNISQNNNNVNHQSRTSDLDNKYLNAVNSGDVETA